jgi:lysophospholipase L1-like esterase
MNILSAQSLHWHSKVKEFANELETTPKGKIVFLGNSITEGFDLKSAFPVSNPVNRGINSDHLDGVLQRLDTSVVLLQPSQLYILLGINDIGRGDPDSLIISRYRTMLQKLTGSLSSVKIYLTSILPVSEKWSNCPKEKIMRINREISQLSQEFQCSWLDIRKSFADENGYLNQNLSHDGLHLNQTGYDIWINKLKKLGLK